MENQSKQNMRRKLSPGRWIDPKGRWFDIDAIAIHTKSGEKLAIYKPVDKSDNIKIAAPLHEIEQLGWRLMKDSDYGPGGAAEYYKEYGGS